MRFMNLQQLREKRASVSSDIRSLLEANPGKAFAANPENKVKYDAGLAELDELNNEIERIEAYNERLAGERIENAVIDAAERLSRDKRDPGLAVYAKFLKGEALNDDDLRIVGNRLAVQNTMSTTTGSEGGYTVESTIAPTLFEAMKEYGGMRDLATVLQTAKGEPLNFPTSDGTSEIGEIVAENGTAADEDATFGTVALNVFKFSSKVITVPIELIMDSVVDIEAFVGRRQGTRLGRITNRKYTIGSGTGEPRGAVTAAGAGKVGASGQTATVIYNDLIDLQHSVDPAYRKGAVWQMHDSSLKVVRKLVDGEGRPIFVPSYDRGIAQGAPAELLGDPLKINQDMPVMAASAKSILYGDHSKYTIREVMAFTAYRFADSAYIKKGQIGFLAWLRAGGNYTDIGGGLKYYQNAAS